jgi:hypothetical protein
MPALGKSPSRVLCEKGVKELEWLEATDFSF